MINPSQAAVPLQPQNPWSPLEQVYAGENLNTPILIADANGALHALWWGRAAGQTEGETVIMYARWQENRWTMPTDIIAGVRGGGAAFPAAIVDERGILHVIWAGPQLYYSTAPAWAAENPRNWSVPIEIGEGKQVISWSDLVLDAKGTLHALFAEKGGTVHHVSSDDGGKTWSSPTPTSAPPPATGDGYVRADLEADGVTLHAVWQRYPLPDGYPPLGVFYARSVDGGATWTSEVELAGPDYGEPEIVINEGVVHVVYNGRAGIGGRYHRMSSDGGQSWSGRLDIIPPGGGGGLTGHPWLDYDSANTLYFIAGEGALIAEWNGQSWSGVQDLRTLAMTSLEYVEQPALAVLQGNQLHVIFWDGRKRLWHTWRTTSAVHVPPTPYAAVLVSPTRESTANKPSPMPPEPTRLPTEQALPSTPMPNPNAGINALVIATVPTLAFVAAVFALSLSQKHRR